jgi:hypothetical protein
MLAYYFEVFPGVQAATTLVCVDRNLAYEDSKSQARLKNRYRFIESKASCWLIRP